MADEKVPTIWFVQRHPALQPWHLQTNTPLHEVARLLAADTIRMRGWPVLTDLKGEVIVVNPAEVACVSLQPRLTPIRSSARS